MSDSRLSSSETSLSSSDSLDSFSNFCQIKPYNFKSTVSDNENTDGEVCSSTLQTKDSEKRTKGKSRLVSLWKMQGYVYQC